MKKYEITLTVDGLYTVEVNAKDSDEAEQIAKNMCTTAKVSELSDLELGIGIVDCKGHITNFK